MTHLYQALLGQDWDKLAAVTQRLHSPDPVALFEGRVDIVRGRNPFASMFAAILGLPKPGRDLPALVRVSRIDGGELLERWYDGRHFATRQGRLAGRLTERFGPFSLAFGLRHDEGELVFDQVGVKLWSLALPRALWPRIRARERADGHAHLFDVALCMPLIGRVVRYQGRLEVAVD